MNYMALLMKGDYLEDLDNMVRYTKKGMKNMKKTVYAVKRASASHGNIDYNYWKCHHKTMGIFNTKEEAKAFLDTMPDDEWFDRQGRSYHFYIDQLTREEA